MKSILFLAFALLVAFGLSAQQTDSSVVFTTKFLRNEYQRYEVSKMLYTIAKRDTVDMQRIGFKAEVVVADSSANAYILKWKVSDYFIQTSDAHLRKLVALATPVQVSYRISKPGVFEEFLTGNTVTDCLEAALPKVLDNFKDKSDSLSKAEVASIYALRENLETLILSYMIQFHQFHGLGYTLGEYITVPVEVASRFSSKPLPGIQRKKLTKIDTENQTATMAYATILDMAGFRQALSANLKTAMEAVRNLQQSEIGSAMIDLRTGWPLWSMNQREASANGFTYGEQLEIQYK
jgi:hypothetical protein